MAASTTEIGFHPRLDGPCFFIMFFVPGVGVGVGGEFFPK